MAYAWAGLTAFLVSLALTPLVRSISLRKQWGLDQPEARKVHTTPLPRLGGIALFGAFLVGIWVARGMGQEVALSRLFWSILGGAAGLIGVGLLDDLRPPCLYRTGLISPQGLVWWAKLLGQFGAAAVAVGGGVHIAGFTPPWNGWHALGSWGYPLTILWIVAMINAVNWLDGLDGLAAGVSFIASTTLATIAFRQQDALAACFLLALAGSLLGFLPYNFNPAKLIMGDTGAMLLGYILATVSVTGVMKSATLVSVGVPLLALGIFIFDSLQAIVSRLRHGLPPYQPDQRHVHHRLLRAGWSHREAVLMIYAISGLLNSAALTLLDLDGASAMLSVAVAGLIFFLCIRRNSPKPGEDSASLETEGAPSRKEKPTAFWAFRG